MRLNEDKIFPHVEAKMFLDINQQNLRRLYSRRLKSIKVKKIVRIIPEFL